MRKSLTVICSRGGGSCREKEFVLKARAPEAVDLTINEVSQHYSGTLNKAAATGLRDALIELFPLEAKVYDATAPKVGDVVQFIAGREYKHATFPAPLRGLEVRGYDLLVLVDACGQTAMGCNADRFETYVPKSQGMGTVPASPKWEVVADDIDRIKVPGGWIYQNIEGTQTFVAEVK